MQLIGHILTFVNCLFEQGYNKDEVEKITEIIIPKLLLPDTIRGLGLQREISHFTKIPNSSSWMEFPINEDLKKLNSKEQINYEFKDKINSDAENQIDRYLPDQSDFELFKEKNSKLFTDKNKIWGKAILTHYKQDEVVSNLWDTTFLDLSSVWPNVIYKLSNNKKQVDWDTFYSEMYQLDEQLYIHWANIMYNNHNLKINQKWIDDHVKCKLKETYSDEISSYPCDKALNLSEEYEKIGEEEYKFPSNINKLEFCNIDKLYEVSKHFFYEATKSSKLLMDKKDLINKISHNDDKYER